MSSPVGIIRGVYSEEEEIVETFKNGGIPVFNTQQECLDWCMKHSSIFSNPEIPNLEHIITHFIGWKQVDKYIIRKYLQHHYMKQRQQQPQLELHLGLDNNRYWNSTLFSKSDNMNAVVDGIRWRMNLPFHQRMNSESTWNTLKYLYHHMRCGVLVSIRDRKVVLFAPFVNDQYRNNWSDNFKMNPPDMKDYYEDKRSCYREENIIPEISSWWVNGNIICNEHMAPGEKVNHWWGDHMLASFKHLLETLCKERNVPDVDFFFNKRDYPQLKKDLTEPYDFCFDEKDRPLDKESTFTRYMPILSFYCSENFADLPIPTTEDWRGAVGKVFPDSFIKEKNGEISKPADLYVEENFVKFYVPWEKKRNTAFFRGTATGGGTTIEDNQRLNIAYMAIVINEETKGTPDAEPIMMDAGVTGFNCRDKKMFGKPMCFLQKKSLPFDKVDFVPMYKQGEYKYILYAQGHCAANRYAFLMRLGSVILKVESTCEAKDMWYFPLLVPFNGSNSHDADHIQVKSDLSNLKETILWCRKNDDICKQIAINAQARYSRCISREAILDYMEVLFHEISIRVERPPLWFSPQHPVTSQCPVVHDYQEFCDNQEYCARCNEILRELKSKENERKTQKNTSDSSSSSDAQVRRPIGTLRVIRQKLS